MSNSTYDEIWKQALCYLEDVVALDSSLQGSKSQRDRKKIHQSVAELYVRYIVIANKLEACYDQMLQPQKRLLIRKMLDATMGRAIELKHQLVDIDLSEHSYYDDVLLKYSLTPQEVELRVPNYFRREREREIAERRKFIENILRELGELEEIVEAKKMTESEAIRLIQTHERARQGRARFQFMKEIREMKERSTLKPERESGDEAREAEATLKIQKVWRGYLARYRIKKRRNEEMLLIGMVQPSQVVTENSRKDERIREYRRAKQKEYEELYERMMLETGGYIRAEKGAIIEENLRSQIRNWINAYFEQTGKIPELPSADSGGSRMILSRQGTESSMSKSTVISSKESKKSKKSKSKKGSPELERSEDESDPGIKVHVSNFLPEIVQAKQEYNDTWRDKDESSNPGQLPYVEMIEGEKNREIEDEIRVGVDEALRGDIEALQAALDRDRGFRGKRGKKSQKRVRRSGKKNKRKKEKDLTPDRTIESLFEELLTNGIIKLHPEVRLTSFKGEKSFGNYDLWERGEDPLPTIGIDINANICDIRQLVAEYCIIPLGNDTLRQLTPLVRSVLIAGPRGSGKKMLVNAICTELGATLFDITPANIAGKYPGKSGLIMLLHLISKVSRLLQPSVILMDGAEKPFVKKIPKNDKTDPKRLKKDLGKLVKAITNDDRVIFVGLSNSPWEGEQKLLYQTYDKVIYIPRPDYGTMSLIWKDLVYKYSGISRQFDTSAMAKICDGFTVGTVVESINEIMTTRRMVQLRVQPLTHAELVNALSARDPVYREEDDAFLAWFAKTPTRRKKQKAAEFEVQKMEEANEKQKKKGKGKK